MHTHKEMNRCSRGKGLSAGQKGRFTVTLKKNSTNAQRTPRLADRPVYVRGQPTDGASHSRLESSSGAQRILQNGSDASRETREGVTDTLKVRDFMTAPVISLSPEMSVFDAMVIMVKKGISGMPVTDDNNHVVGVCSGYDLLALDSTPGKLDKSYFPPIDKCINEFGGDRALMWSNFKELRRKLTASNCDTVGQVMHSAFSIQADAELEDAANMVVQRRAHRICVVNSSGELVGLVSRGDIMRTTIAKFRVYMQDADERDQKRAEVKKTLATGA